MQPTSEKRANARSNVLFVATLRCGDIDLPVQLRNLSEGGAMVANGTLPLAGASLALKRNDTMLRGRLVWSSNGKAGLRFEGASCRSTA